MSPSTESDPDERRLAAIEAVLDAARPAIRADGGDLELASVEPGLVRVRLTGNCTHCAMAGQTLGGLRRALQQALGESIRVLPAPPASASDVERRGWTSGPEIYDDI
jgi:Fe-S cluster biogenesis protein NfuA